MKKSQLFFIFIFLTGISFLFSACDQKNIPITDRNGNTILVDAESSGDYSFFLPEGTAPATISTENEKCPFIDVEKQDWFYDAVMKNYTNGLMRGTSDITFSPNDPVSRGMAAATLWRLENTPLAEESSFIDVPADQYYAQAAAWASSVYIVSGFDTEHFAPDEPITREQLAAVLYRYTSYKGYDTSAAASLKGFTDYADISGYAAPAIAWAVEEGYLSGMEDGTLQPKGIATRAQFASLLRHFQ